MLGPNAHKTKPTANQNNPRLTMTKTTIIIPLKYRSTHPFSLSCSKIGMYDASELEYVLDVMKVHPSLATNTETPGATGAS